MSIKYFCDICRTEIPCEKNVFFSVETMKQEITTQTIVNGGPMVSGRRIHHSKQTVCPNCYDKVLRVLGERL